MHLRSMVYKGFLNNERYKLRGYDPTDIGWAYCHYMFVAEKAGLEAVIDSLEHQLALDPTINDVTNRLRRTIQSAKASLSEIEEIRTLRRSTWNVD